MIEMSKGVIYGLFFIFLVFGALLGLKRGLAKATIRIITVIICCVVTTFLVSSVTSALLSADLSSTGLTIGDVPLTNLNDTLIAYLGSLLGVGDLLNASPTLVAIIKSVPAIFVNLVLFILIFFVLKAILYFVDIFLNRLIIKKDSEKPKRRLFGALVGAGQGLICFLFCFIPIAGTMNVLTDTVNVIEPVTHETPSTVSAVSVTQVREESDEAEDHDPDEIRIETESTIEGYNDIFIVKMFNTIGYRALTDAVYDKLTTIEINEKESTTLRAESIIIAKVMNSFNKLLDVDVAEFSATDQQNANQLIDDAFSSPIIGGVSTEIVSGVADAWATTEPTEFVGIAKPELDTKLLECFDNLLLSIRSNTKEDLQKDLKVLVATLKVSADHDLTSSVNTGDTDLLVSALGKEGCMEEVIKTLASGKATKEIIPSFIEFGLSYGYDAVGIENLETNITKSASEVNWEREPVILGDLFEGVSATYQSSKGEGPVLTRLDLVSFAKVLEALRDSELLADSSQELTVHLLSSNLVVGVDCDTLLSYVQNDNTYQNMDFTVMLSTLKSSAEIASDLKDITSGTGDATSLDSNDVGNLIDGLTSTNEASKEVMKDLASTENLEKSGVDSATAGAVNVLVNSVTEYDTTADGAVAPPESEEEKQKATSAVEDLLVASKNAKTGNTEQQIFETEQDMEEFVDSMLSSPFVWAVTIDKGIELGFKTESSTNLTATEQTWLDEILEEKTTAGTCTENQASDLRKMFIP